VSLLSTQPGVAPLQGATPATQVFDALQVSAPLQNCPSEQCAALVHCTHSLSEQYGVGFSQCWFPVHSAQVFVASTQYGVAPPQGAAPGAHVFVDVLQVSAPLQKSPSSHCVLSRHATQTSSTHTSEPQWPSLVHSAQRSGPVRQIPEPQ
jgi:hypothetical protein